MSEYDTYVESAMDRADGDRDRAREYLLADASIHEELRTHLIRLGADQLLRGYSTRGRAAADAFPDAQEWVSRRESDEKLRQAGKRFSKFWDQYTLFGGKVRLRDATRPQLIASAVEHEKMAGAHTARARNERAWAAWLPNDTSTVSQNCHGDVRRLPKPLPPQSESASAPAPI